MALAAFRCKTGIHNQTGEPVEDFDGNELGDIIIKQGTLVMLDENADWVKNYIDKGTIVKQGSQSTNKPKTFEQLMKMKKDALFLRAADLSADVEDDATKEQLADAIIAIDPPEEE